MTKTYYVYYMLMRPVDLGAQLRRLLRKDGRVGREPRPFHL